MIVEYRPSVMEDGETKGMAQYIVDYFEYIYGL